MSNPVDLNPKNYPLPFDSFDDKGNGTKGEYDNISVFIPGDDPKKPRVFTRDQVIVCIPGLVSVLDEDGDQLTFMNEPIVIEKRRSSKSTG